MSENTTEDCLSNNVRFLLNNFFFNFLSCNHARTFSKSDGSKARVEHDATNQQLPSLPCVMSCLLDPSTNRFGESGVQISYGEKNCIRANAK